MARPEQNKQSELKKVGQIPGCGLSFLLAKIQTTQIYKSK